MGVACGLMAMGWMDDTGSWNWNQTRTDLDSLPIRRFHIHHCVNRKVKEYKKSGLNWNTCKSTFTTEQQEYVDDFLRDVARIECIHDKLTKGCCNSLPLPLMVVVLVVPNCFIKEIKRTDTDTHGNKQNHEIGKQK